MFKLAESIGLSVIRKITDLWSSAKADSLIDYTAVTRVEPICLIDTDVVNDEMLPDVMQSLQSIFAGYYLQAMAISTNVGRISVMHHLDKLNPKRNPVDSAIDTAGWLMAMESYKHRLPMPDNQLAMEAEGEQTKAILGRDTLPTLRDLANLSVGKMLSVEITDGNHTATIPVSIRLMASSIPTGNLIHILSVGNKDTSVKERYHAWRAGRLEFIRDLIFCQDLIDAHRKNLIEDKTGVYGEILKRRQNNRVSTMLSGNPSVASASNLLVCSSETIEALEAELSIKFKDFASREKIFKATYMMIIAVVDRQWSRVTFYHRGINTTTEVGLRDLRSANKNTGPDVAEILKAYQLGNSPSL